MNIVLSGFMGAGKTTTGRRLARMLKLPFADVDAQIERERGPISEIFAREGEAQFRLYETETIARLVAEGPAVIAVGGGAVLSAANRKLLRRNGYIVYLAISPEIAYERVSHRRHRPLLGERPDMENIRAILAKRKEAYSDADFSIAVGRRDPMVVARAIARWYRGKRRLAANQAVDG